MEPAFVRTALVAILGDVTTDGLPPEDDPGRAAAEAPVRALIDALADVEGQVVVVPGDRDWAQGEDGVKRLEDLLDDAFGDDVLTPGDQAGGPRQDKLADGLRIVSLDTAWWLLDRDDRPEGEAEDQDVRDPGDVARILQEILVDRDDDQIVVLAHHPLISRGPRAGYRPDPLSSFAGRTVGLGRQDLSSSSYRRLRESLGPIASSMDGLVWAASHDRILQTYDDVVSTLHRQTHLVSGTGGGLTATSGADGALYVSSVPGYERLVYYADGRLWSETVEIRQGQPQVVFRAQLAGPNAELVDTEVPDDVDPADLPPNLGGTVTTAADADFVTERFSNSAVTRALLGRNYRDVWKTEVEFRVLDLGTEAGGMTPVKRGGGLQTTSLRLIGDDGHEYGLRLLEKGGLAQVPYEVRDGLIGDVVLELRAAMNPYAALVVAPLAEAAGVPQPSPEIVYVPDDPRLGRYRATFADRLALLEIRPDDDMSDVPGFEGITEVVSSSKLREEMREDHDHRVDQRAFLRARLLDMLVADWDRHADQWRWAAFEPGTLDPTLTGEDSTRGKVYRPIARDRDFAYYGIDGLLQPILHQLDSRLQSIDDDYGSIRGLTQNGFFQDRRFLTELTREDWRQVAEDLQARLTDTAIERSIGRLPGPIYARLGPWWTRVTTSRRDRLVEAAMDYYELQAATVDVIGSDQREVFDVERHADGSMTVTVRDYKDADPGRQLYRRTFVPSETDEVRLYGFGGRDAFRVSGDDAGGIALRIIGGAGEDEVDAQAGRVMAYDTPDGMTFDHRQGVSDRRSTAPDVNRYDEGERVLGNHVFGPTFGYRATDGVILGGEYTWIVPGFRLKPYAARHHLGANVATATGGVSGYYIGRMREAIGEADLDVDVTAQTPRYARNFYGLGNGSPEVEGDLARVDLARIQARAGLGVSLGEGFRLNAGPSLRYADASQDTTLLAPTPVALLPADAFDPAFHGGAFLRIEASTVDDAVNPAQGLRLVADGSVLAGLAGEADTYGAVGGEAVAYIPVRLAPQLTLALRAGAEHRIGDFPFFDAATLGGDSSLRGYRRERFAGRTAASASAEARAKLVDIDFYVLPAEIGLLGFIDAGRVWSADSPLPAATYAGDDLQLGYGGGLWFNLLDRALFNFTVGASDENVLVTVGFGFAY